MVTRYDHSQTSGTVESHIRDPPGSWGVRKGNKTDEEGEGSLPKVSGSRHIGTEEGLLLRAPESTPWASPTQGLSPSARAQRALCTGCRLAQRVCKSTQHRPLSLPALLPSLQPSRGVHPSQTPGDTLDSSISTPRIW